MHIIVFVVSDEKKKVGSSLGMKISVANSELLKYRADVCVPKRVNDMEEAILEKNFPAFGELTMKESNQFHAVCLDTFPPCVYMNDASHNFSDFVHRYNKLQGEIRVSFK